MGRYQAAPEAGAAHPRQRLHRLRRLRPARCLRLSKPQPDATPDAVWPEPRHPRKPPCVPCVREAFPTMAAKPRRALLATRPASNSKERASRHFAPDPMKRRCVACVVRRRKRWKKRPVARCVLPDQCRHEGRSRSRRTQPIATRRHKRRRAAQLSKSGTARGKQAQKHSAA